MSFFGLFGNKAPRTAEGLPDRSGLDNGGNTQPVSSGIARKSARLGQRELLYSAVRDVMIRAGVLVASYRFKVLSLDAQGRQYLIMMDLLKIDMGDMKRLGEIESMIVEAAQRRHDLVVTGVYWRTAESEKPNLAAALAPDAVGSSAPLSRASGAASTSGGLQRDEGEPLKRTAIRLASEKSRKHDVTPSAKSKRSLPPEFEDTRVIQPTEYGSPLSATQYGDLE